MKSPNKETKQRQARENCWYCENYSRSRRKCSCRYANRTANKRRWRNEVKKEVIELRHCGPHYPFIGPQF